MELQLKNIGMIKEAKVKLDGLTVIAGENDTGKSTVGKALFMFLNSFNFVHKNITSYSDNPEEKKKLKTFLLNNNEFEKIVGTTYLPELIFKSNIKNAEFLLSDNDDIIHLYIDKDNRIASGNETVYTKNKESLSPTMIETPLVWNFIKLIKDLSLIESKMQINIDYPYLMNDLIFKLSIKSKHKGIDIKKELSNIIDGEFCQDDKGEFYFKRKDKRIELENTATGIKSFGILQVLSENNWLNKNALLILDEPEVHLHPKWQLKMAQIIVLLVKNGVKVLVNSHSPYMIEALQRYSEKEDVISDFYLPKNGVISKVSDSNSETLAKTFEKLSEPFDVFEEMDSQRMEKLING